MLFFIERDELDIYDIPISKITNDFLEYIHQLEKMDGSAVGKSRKSMANPLLITRQPLEDTTLS